MNDMNVKFLVPSSKKEYGYIGFDADSDNSTFVFPCKYLSIDTDENQCKIEARRLISLIKRVEKENYFGGSGEQSFQFYSMTWLIQDFIDRGYYVEQEKIVKKDIGGKINWKRTIKNNQIFFDNGNIIFREFLVNKNMLDVSNLVSETYKFCLQLAVSKFGFLFGIKRTQKSKFSDNAHNIKYMCGIVKESLKLTNNTYKKLLLNHLLTILNCQNGKMHSLSLFINDKEFEYVFEFLVNSVFGTENIKEYYTKCSYVIDNNIYNSSTLRPDTVMRNVGNTCPDYYVIDAKYYNYGYSNQPKDLPQSSSIIKQIAYNHYLTNKNKKEFYSVFMLPCAMNNLEKIKFVGYAQSQYDPKDFKDKVAVCLIDLKVLVDVHLGISNITKDDLRNELKALLKSNKF